MQALEFTNPTKIGGELFDFASTIHDKSAAGAQGNAIFDKKVFEFCQTVLKFLRFNVSSRALYAQMSRATHRVDFLRMAYYRLDPQIRWVGGGGVRKILY